MRAARGPAVFLDKDGTLIEDLPYNVDPRRIRLAPGSREGIRRLGRAGARLVVATNQSGVARGYFGEADLRAVERHLAAELAALGAHLEGFYFCPHLPDGINEFARDCDCRKPLPGLIHRAAADLGIDPSAAWFVGDTWMDVLAGRAAGCRTIMIGAEWRDAAGYVPERQPDHAVPDLAAAADIILAEWAAGGGAPSPGAAERVA